MQKTLAELHEERFPTRIMEQDIYVPALDQTMAFPAFKALQWKLNPWLWIVEQVYTIDESDGLIKPFPNYQYLRMICEKYFENKILVIPKTRRQMLTHLGLSGILVHQFLFKDKSDNIFVSMSEEKAKKAFRKRATNTLQHLDHRFDVYPKLRKNKDLLSQRAVNPLNKAELAAIPSGADKCRGDTLTNAIYDEFAFQTDCEENLQALKPALEGKDCRAMIISSPRPGTVFEELTKIKEDSGFTQLMQGLSMTMNELNHTVIKCHYTAHPHKRSPEWYHKERYGTTPDGEVIPGESGVDTFTWLQEYEGEFNFPKGERAIWEYDEELVCQPYLKICPTGYMKEFPLYISFDFGSNYPAVTFGQPDSLNRFIIHDGILVYKERLKAFIARVMSELDEYYVGWRENFKIFCDPSGFKGTRDGNEDPGAYEIEKAFGTKVTNRKKVCKPIEGIYALNDLCAEKVGQSQQIVINPAAGKFLNEKGKFEYGWIPKGFLYGYSLVKPKPGHAQQIIVEKDGRFDHLMDTIRWIVQWRWKSIRMRDQEMRQEREKRIQEQKRKRRKIKSLRR